MFIVKANAVWLSCPNGATQFGKKENMSDWPSGLSSICFVATVCVLWMFCYVKGHKMTNVYETAHVYIFIHM